MSKKSRPIGENLFDNGGSFEYVNNIKSIKILKDHILVTDMEFDGVKLASGIQLLSDNGKSEGIRARWAKVYAIGDEQKEIKVGQWVMVEHGRWTRGINLNIDGEKFVARMIDPAAIIFVSDSENRPDCEEIPQTVGVNRQSRGF